jgi:hypothetical protein
MLCLMERLPPLKGTDPKIANLKSKAETVSKQFGAWLRSVQNSGMKGERYVTDRTRKKGDASQQRKAFLEELNRIRNQGS